MSFWGYIYVCFTMCRFCVLMHACIYMCQCEQTLSYLIVYFSVLKDRKIFYIIKQNLWCHFPHRWTLNIRICGFLLFDIGMIWTSTKLVLFLLNCQAKNYIYAIWNLRLECLIWVECGTFLAEALRGWNVMQAKN